MFKTIYLDCPWPERGGGRCKRGADRHYELITSKHEMLRTIIQSPMWQPADDAHMYMWATDNYLEWATWLIPALGFKRHRALPWTKSRMGLGQYFRSCHEWLLFATRGKGKRVCEPGTFRTDALVGAPQPVDERGRRIHSAKPEAAYDLIEARSRGPYLEMFAREQREGWDAWGSEIDD